MPKQFNLLARGVLFMFFLAVLNSNVTAQKTITGKVMDSDAKPLSGVTIKGKGTNQNVITSDDGKFSINLPSNVSQLEVTTVGFETKTVSVGSGSALDIILVKQVSNLNEVVVTGYSSQRKKDIIGAVSVVNVEDLKTTPTSNLAAQLQGRAAGVVVSSTGAPGAAAVVRIRGFQSFGNNDPLYVIDGVPTQDPTQLNPQDIESMQVLKDATAASIYGTRAANGVVIVTTKRGRAGRNQISYDGYAGFQKITAKMIPDLLNNSQYIDYLNKTTSTGNKHVVFGQFGSYAVPANIVVSNDFKGGVPANDPKANADLYSLVPGSIYQIYQTSQQGTDWFKEAIRDGFIQSHQISASGGNEKAVYSVGMNYFSQEGTFKFTNYKRYTVRANSSIKATNWLRFGENLQISVEDRLGNDNRGEAGAWSQAYRMVPYIPVYDIKGGWGGNGMGESGNGTNPVAQLYRQKDNTNRVNKMFGNLFAELMLTNYLTARTSFGVDLGNQAEKIIGYKTYERQENQGTTQLTEQSWSFVNWTWTNTLNFQKTFFNDHDVKILVGTEAIKRDSRGHRAYGQEFDFDDPNFISLDRSGLADRRIENYNTGKSSIYSLFGRLDYAFKGKYLINGTVRRDGASVFGPENRYATFPSIGIGWRISEENFMKSAVWLNDLKLRGGWGKVGSISNVDQANAFSTFSSSPGSTSYDINGANTSSTQGYAASRLGNPDTKWETTTTQNIGLDVSILQGKWNLSVDVYKNDTKDLLVERLRNSLEPNLVQPKVNIGTMRNSGFELTLNNKGNITRELGYDVALSFSHYKNELIKMNEEGTVRLVGLDRLSNALITRAGLPVSSFYGYQVTGFYNTESDVTKGPKIQGKPGVMGSWMFKDINNDGDITDADRTILGDPHPDFQMGANIGLNYKHFDFNVFLFWNQGNEIYNYTKYYTDMRVFVGGISTRVLNDSWTPNNTGAKLPQLGLGNQNGFTGFVTGNSNSYYVEDGSYLRAKTVQLGYTLPSALCQKAKLSGVRIYLQAQNMFTISGYSGPDPDINIINNNGTDTYIGVDRTGFPNPKEFLLGLNITF
jgi:TonB-dependent starch-binding outer membrane protein SusC